MKPKVQKNRNAPRQSPYRRIMRAAEQGKGLKLSADEVAELAQDTAIQSAAINDEAGGWVT